MATRPPFKCAECRRDVTAWFVEAFSWVDAEAPEQVAAELLRQADELQAELQVIRDNAVAERNRIIADTMAFLNSNNERFQADMAGTWTFRRG